MSLPRWIDYHGPMSAVELHGFSDASSRAYAAAVYLRCTDGVGKVHVHLMVAKTKVAPVKQVSIPRLELCGALLVARLLSATVDALGWRDVPVVAWTDAAVVLAWIRSHPARWKPFVANRVSELQRLLPPHAWRYVPTTDNPADAATRGISPDELVSLDLWWRGPSWLREADYLWTEPGISHDVSEEERRAVAALVARPPEDHPVLSRFSTLSRLLRVTAFCFRFLHNSRHRSDRRIGFLTRAELETA